MPASPNLTLAVEIDLKDNFDYAPNYITNANDTS